MDIHLKVKPNSRENTIAFENDALVVRVNASPVDGKANKALLDYLSIVFEVPKSRIEIEAGAGSRFKKIRIPQEYATKVDQFLAGLKAKYQK